VEEHPTGVYEFKGEDSLTFESQFEICHTKNNTIAYNELSNVVRDSCDPGAIESYGIGKGHNVSFNAIHDVTQPPVLFHTLAARSSQVISLLFSDAQTHYSEYRGNVLFESNACLGDGAMIKNWQTNFEGNIMADSSMPRAAWVGSYSGPVGDMTFSHNVYWNTTGYCNGPWPSTTGHFVAPPHSPTGLGANFVSGNYALDNGEQFTALGVGYGGVLANATGTCYHTMDVDNTTGSIGCNHYPNCNWPGHMSNYHLSQEQLETPVVSYMDYDLHDMPTNPNLTKALKLTNKSWNQHSVQATKDPFARVNKPWRTNVTDFAAVGEQAQAVQHVPVPVDKIGLGPFFDLAFDRALIGRRQLFREGDTSSIDGSPRFHFEDNDRVRGLTVSASLGLIATAEFPMGATTWAAFRNVQFNNDAAHIADADTVVVSVRAQTNAKGGCGDFVALNLAGEDPMSSYQLLHETLHPFNPRKPVHSSASVAPAPTTKHVSEESTAPCAAIVWNSSDLVCDGIPASGKGGSCGRIAGLSNVATAALCCERCKSTTGCMFFTSSPGDQRKPYTLGALLPIFVRVHFIPT
jgi:hypothetical protein